MGSVLETQAELGLGPAGLELSGLPEVPKIVLSGSPGSLDSSRSCWLGSEAASLEKDEVVAVAG